MPVAGTAGAGAGSRWTSHTVRLCLRQPFDWDRQHLEGHQERPSIWDSKRLPSCAQRRHVHQPHNAATGLPRKSETRQSDPVRGGRIECTSDFGIIECQLAFQPPFLGRHVTFRKASTR